VLEGTKLDGKIKGNRLTCIGWAKRPAKLDPWAFEQPGVGISQEALKRLIDRVVAEVERRLQVKPCL
jgi:hypothetical protein